MEFSDKEIPFLYILIKQDNSGIWMDLYHKPTDAQRCHTPQVVENTA